MTLPKCPECGERLELDLMRDGRRRDSTVERVQPVSWWWLGGMIVAFLGILPSPLLLDWLL